MISHVLWTNNDIWRKFIFLTGFPAIWLAERSELAALLLVEECGVPAPASAMFQSLTKHLCQLLISDLSVFRDFWAVLESSGGFCEPKSECAVISDLGNSGAKCQGSPKAPHMCKITSHMSRAIVINVHQSSSNFLAHYHQLERESWLTYMRNALNSLKGAWVRWYWTNPVVHCLLYICIWYPLLYLDFSTSSYSTVFLKSENNVLTLILEDIADKKCEDEIKEDTFSFVSLNSFVKLHSTNSHSVSFIPHTHIHP